MNPQTSDTPQLETVTWKEFEDWLHGKPGAGVLTAPDAATAKKQLQAIQQSNGDWITRLQQGTLDTGKALLWYGGFILIIAILVYVMVAGGDKIAILETASGGGGGSSEDSGSTYKPHQAKEPKRRVKESE